MKKVCLVISSLEIGGAQQLLAKLCTSLTHHEFEFIVVCLASDTALASELRNHGIEVYCLRMRGFRHIIHGIARLRDILKSERPNLVHSWLYHADFMATAAMISQTHSCPLIWSVHHANEDFKCDKSTTKFVLRLLSMLSGYFPTAVIYCSEYAKKVHLAFGYNAKENIVINNGIDINKFSPSILLRKRFREQQGIAECTPVVGMVARYSPVKGHKVFLEMARELRTWDCDILFVMVGTDIIPNNKELNQTIESLGLQNNILLLGERSDIESVMNGMDVLVCPSYSESFGLVPVEALACELPVVCSDLETLKSIVGGQYTAPIGDVHILADKVYQIVFASSHDRKTIGSNGRKRVIHTFDEEIMLEQYRAVYNKFT